MKVLHIITGLGVGGAEQQLRLLLRHLPYEADVVTLTNPGTVARAIVREGGRVRNLDMAGNRDLAALPRLTKLIARGRYDVVHTHLYRACLYGRLAAKLARVRTIVATEHSLGEARMEGRPLGPGVRGLYLASERLGTTTVAVSPTIAHRLARWGVPEQRIQVVPNGVDAAQFAFSAGARIAVRRQLGLPDGAFVVGAVGRLAAGKRFHTLIDAIAELPDAWLVFAGGGEQEQPLRARAERLGVGARVVFAGECVQDNTTPAGHRPSLAGVLSAVDCLASPSGEEAFGLAVVEGLAAGLPVAYVTCPAIDDLPAGSAPGALRTGRTAAAFAATLGELRRAARPRLPVPDAVRRYCVTATSAQLVRVYEAAAARAPQPHPAYDPGPGPGATAPAGPAPDGPPAVPTHTSPKNSATTSPMTSPMTSSEKEESR
ncbi:glycosyl transferase [Streptomyces sp. CB01201]|uniref:glycosyltransferase n=1 Tax=Streptomyces sp. CB01201 TaxID=2020324 RepID=UPI000C27BCED|nr:glycosyltransferase [Streptomyces sp. CB01201]PJN03970.1 glycosyl transferase [Streptomyces sp. CB01201]